MSKKVSFYGGIFLFTFLFCLPLVASVFAIEDGALPGGSGLAPPPVEKVDPLIANDDLRGQILTIVNYFLTFLGLIAVVAVIYFGFLMVVAGGDEEQYTKARKGIIYIGIGIILILLSYAIVSFFVSATISDATAANTASSRVGFNTNRSNVDRDEAEYQLQKRIEDIYLEIDEREPSRLLYASLAKDFRNILDGLPTSDTTEIFRYQFEEGQLKRKYNNIFLLFNETESAVLAQRDQPDFDESKALQGVKKKLITAFRDLADAMEHLPRVEVVVKTQPSDGPAPLTVTMSGIETIDPSRMTVPKDHYRWSYVDSTGAYRDLGTGVVKVHTFDEANAYRIKLRVQSLDATVLPGLRTFRIEVKPRETRADFLVNGDSVVTVHNVSLKEAKAGIEFDPSSSVPGDGLDIIEYRWDFKGHTESRTTNEKILYPFSTAGDYKMSLTVTDSMGKKSKKNITINVNPSIAVIKMLGKATRVGEEIIFDGAASSVENSTSFQYLWELYDDTGTKLHTFSDARFPYTFDEPGEYRMELTVGKGFKTVETFVITPKPPTPIFSSAQKSQTEPGTLRFDAGSTHGAGQQSLRYAWDFDGDGRLDEQESMYPITEHTYSAPGEYAVTLEVTDAYGIAATVTKTVRVDSVFNVRLLLDRAAAQAGQAIAFEIDAPKGVQFQWDFGDGIIETQNEQKNITHTYAAAGTYQVQVLVTNSDGETNSVVKTVIIGDGTTPVPLAQVTVDGKEVPLQPDLCGVGKSGISLFRNQLLQLDASASVNTYGQPVGLEYVWDFHDNAFQDGARTARKFSEISTASTCERITLLVKDQQSGAQKTADDIYVFVKNALPVISELTVQSAKFPCSTPCLVDVAAIGARDPDGSIEEYRWWAYREGNPEKVAFSVTKDAQTTLSIPALGAKNDQSNFFFAVEVVDAEGGSILSEEALGKSRGITIINQDNPVPEVDFSSSKQYVNAGEPITFTASLRDPNGAMLSSADYAWDFDGDGTFDDTAGGVTTTHAFAEAGTYSVRLRATVNGISNSAMHTITVTESIAYPLASFYHTILENQKVTVDAADSRADPLSEGQLEYSWDFDAKVDSNGNGVPDDDIDASGVQAKHQFDSVGLYEIVLRVTDTEGTVNEERQMVELRQKNAASAHMQKTPFLRTPRLVYNLPAANLELLVRRGSADTQDELEITTYGTDLDMLQFSEKATFRLVEGDGEFVGETAAPFANGFASTRFKTAASQKITIVEVTTDSTLGGISERIEFVPSDFFDHAS